MTFSLLTYNVLFNKAFLQLEKILLKYKPDLLCFQEVDTSEKNLSRLDKFGYTLADYSNSFIKFGKIYGVATYFNRNKFKFLMSDSLKISTNLSEFFFTLIQTLVRQNKPKTVLRTDLLHKQTRSLITICNAHMLVIAPNSLRTNHINKALGLLNIKNKTKLIIGGDFNYLPYRRKRLEKMMKKYGLTEATKNIQQTFDINIVGDKGRLTPLEHLFMKFIDKIFSHRMKNDYIFFRGLQLKKTKRIEVGFSDHYPIISTFKIT